MAQAFRSVNRVDPTLDTDGARCFMLQQVYRGYKNLDPPTKQQKAIPVSVLRKMYNLAKLIQNAPQIARAELACLAFFFCMRSCEYSKTVADESKRTKTLTIGNARFFKNRILLPHTSFFLATADLVDITFMFQKNDDRNESVGMHRAENSKDFMCPVKLAASIVQRVLSYPGSSSDSKLNLMISNKGTPFEISSTSIRKDIKNIVKIMGPEILGFSSGDVGTHSIRSGGAMALHLANVSPLTIMMIGRWRSDAFLLYIRKQVQQFSIGLSDRMLESEDYFTTPDYRNIASPSDPAPALASPNELNGLNHGTTPSLFPPTKPTPLLLFGGRERSWW